MSQYLQFLRQEVGKYVKSVILREILKILKNPFAVYDRIFYFSKQFLSHFRHKNRIEDISQINMYHM